MLADVAEKTDQPPSISMSLAGFFADNGQAPPDWDEVDALISAPDIHPEIRSEAAALLQNDDALRSITDSAVVAHRCTPGQRLAYHTVSRLLRRESGLARRSLLDELPNEPSPLDGLTISPKKGVLIVRPKGWNIVDAAVAEARAAFAAGTSGSRSNPGKTFMTTARIERPLSSSVMALGRHPAILRLVGRYLGGLPIFTRFNLLRSSNESWQENSSQFFHIDPEAFRTMKLFLLVSDVSEDAGPLHLLHADASDAVRLRLQHSRGRLTDDQVFAISGRESLEVGVGPSGTMIFGDTCRCFHFGSRPGARERLVVMYQYLCPSSCYWPIEAQEALSNYAGPVSHARERSGTPLPEIDRYLFGLIR